MCGRSTGSRSVPNLRVITGASRFLRAARHRASHNVCPGNAQPVLRRHRGQQDDDLKSDEDEDFEDDDEEMTQGEHDAEEGAHDRSSEGHVEARAEAPMCGRAAPMTDDPVLANSSTDSTSSKTQPEDDCLSVMQKPPPQTEAASAFDAETQKEPLTQQPETESKVSTLSFPGKETATSSETSKFRSSIPEVSKPSSGKTHVSSIPEVAKQKTPSGDLKTVLHMMRWGIVPSYTKHDDLKSAFNRSFKMINARSEKLCGIWKRLAQSKRCVLPADGFFEWHKQTKAGAKQKKRPFFIRLGEGEPMFMAALWDKWHSPDRETQPDIYSYTVVTTEASKKLAWIHDRMPLILDAEGCRKWLDTEKYSVEDLGDIVRPWKGDIEWYEVPSEYVGNSRDKSEKCIQRMSDYEAKKRTQGIHRFFSAAPKKTATKSSATKKEDDDVRPVKKTPAKIAKKSKKSTA